jgi:hypothetical protein
MALSKYIKQPLTQANLSGYTDNELRKIELAFSNFLADFEELQEMALTEAGAFTPVIKGATTPGVGTYTRQEGRYYKIGRMVIVFFRVTTTAHTGTGAIQIEGLPYPAHTFSGGNSYFSSRLYGNSSPAGLILQGTAFISPFDAAGAAVTIVAAMDFTGSITYFVD